MHLLDIARKDSQDKTSRHFQTAIEIQRRTIASNASAKSEGFSRPFATLRLVLIEVSHPDSASCCDGRQEDFADQMSFEF